MIEFLEQMPDNQKYGILLGIVVVIVGGYYILFYRDYEKQINSLNSKIASLDNRILEAKITAERREEFRRELAMIRAYLNKTIDVLPDEDEMDSLLSNIQSLATQAGLDPKTFKPGEPLQHDFYGEVPIAMETEGGYHEMGDFFERIANEERIVNIGNITMQKLKGKSADRGRTVKCSFIARAFFFHREAAAGEGEGGADGEDEEW